MALKILIVAPYRYLASEMLLGRALKRLGHDVEFVTSDLAAGALRSIDTQTIRGGSYAEFRISHLKALFEIPGRYGMPYVRDLPKVFCDGYDVVIATDIHQFHTLQHKFAHLRTRVPPLLLWSHLIRSCMPGGIKGLAFRLYLWVMAKVVQRDHIIATSRESEKLLERLGLRSTFRVPFAVDCRRFLSCAKRRQRGQKGVVTVLFGGRLEVYKGVYDLVDAVHGLDEQTKSRVHVIIWGSGPELSRIQKEIDPRLFEIISEPIPFEETPRIYSRADIFVLPSYIEAGTGPLSLFEAASCGLPLVSTIGNTEAIVPGENGYLIVPGDVDALRNCVRELVWDDKLRDRMGRYSQQYMAKTFDIDVVARRCAKMLELTIGGAAGGGRTNASPGGDD